MEFLSLPLADPAGKTSLNIETALDVTSGVVAELTEFDAVLEGMTAIPALAIVEQDVPAPPPQDSAVLDPAQRDFVAQQTPLIPNPASPDLIAISARDTPDASVSAPQKTENLRDAGRIAFQTALTPQPALPAQASPANQGSDPAGSGDRPIDLRARQTAAMAAPGAADVAPQDQGRAAPVEPGRSTNPSALLDPVDSRTNPVFGSSEVLANQAKTPATDAAATAPPNTFARPAEPAYQSAQPVPSDREIPANDPASPPLGAQEPDGAKATVTPTAPTTLIPQPAEAGTKSNAPLATVATQSATAPMQFPPGVVGAVETTGNQTVDIALPVKSSTTTEPDRSLRAADDHPAQQPAQKAAEPSAGERPSLAALPSNAGPMPQPPNAPSFAPAPVQGTPVAPPAYNMVAPPATASQMAVTVTQLRAMPGPQDKAPDRSTPAPAAPATPTQSTLSTPAAQSGPLASTTLQPLAATPARPEQPIALGTETTGLFREASFGTVTGGQTSPGAVPSQMAPNPVHLPPQVMAQLAEMAPELRSGPVEIQLSPEELGRVRLSLVTTDTTVQIQIAAERPETQDLIRRHIDLLANDLRQQGFTDVSFSFGTGSGGDTAPQGNPAQSDPFDADLPPQVADTSRQTLTIAPSARLDIRL